MRPGLLLCWPRHPSVLYCGHLEHALLLSARINGTPVTFLAGHRSPAVGRDHAAGQRGHL